MKVPGILKSNAAKMTAALLAAGVLSGASLVFVYNYATPRINVNIEKETRRAIENVFAGGSRIEDIKKDELFRVKDAQGKLLGYAFIAEGNGYQGTIKLLAGVNGDMTAMEGMEVLESQETPGLGAEIAAPSFRKQFDGLDITHPVEYVKNQKPDKPYRIEAITGATISSRAVVNILNKEIENVRKTLGGTSR